jgi:hypothetical protein
VRAEGGKEIDTGADGLKTREKKKRTKLGVRKMKNIKKFEV